MKKKQTDFTFNSKEDGVQDGETVGALLKRTREERKLSVDEVSKELNIKKEHIEAMESDTILNFLPGAYARGFVMNYAEFLDLDHHSIGEEFDKLYQSEIPQIRVQEIGPIMPVERRSRRSKGLFHYTLYVLLVVTLVVGYFVLREHEWFGLLDHEDEAPARDEGNNDESEPEKKPEETSQLVLELHFNENVQVSGNEDGTRIFPKIYGGGTTEKFDASEKLVLEIDEGEKVKVFKDGKIQRTGTGKVRLTLDANGLEVENLDE